MLEHFIEFMLPEIVSILEIIGIVVITIGSLKAFYHYIKALFTHKHYPIRIELANALALGLEFKMGAEILKMCIRDSKKAIKREMRKYKDLTLYLYDDEDTLSETSFSTMEDQAYVGTMSFLSLIHIYCRCGLW